VDQISCKNLSEKGYCNIIFSICPISCSCNCSCNC
jgi:hypothetical protein